MAFCYKCGKELPDGAKACPYCGTFVENVTDAQQPTTVQATVTSSDPDVQQNRGIAWLAYCGLLLLIPLFVKKASAYCQFHVKQGATLLATEIAYGITKAIFLGIINLIFPGTYYYWIHVPSTAYTVFNVIFSLGYIFFVVMAVIGIVSAATGKKKELPLISKIPWINMLMDKIYAGLNK